jgi:hypothetical protein
MNREQPPDALEAALEGVVGVRNGASYELPWPPAGPERSWVLTGQGTADPRRAQGPHSRVRRLLVGEAAVGARDGQWADFSRAMERRAVTESLSALPAEQREVVRLAYFEGLTNRAVAGTLGLSLAGVRRRLRLALKELETGLRRAGSSLSGTLVAPLAGWLDRANQGREVVVAAAGTAAAATAVVMIVSTGALASGSAPARTAPGVEFNISSAGAAPAPGAWAPAMVAPDAGGPAAAGGVGRPDAALPVPPVAPVAVVPNPVSTVAAAAHVPGVSVVDQVAAQVKAAVPPVPAPPTPAIKPPGGLLGR